MNSRIIAKAVFACLLWGSAFAGAKIGFEYAPPIYLSGLRFTLAGLLLVPVMQARHIRFGPALRHWKFMLLFAFLQTFLQYGLFFMGLDQVPGATAAIIIGGGPLFVAVMAHFTLRNDPMTWRKITAIALGLAGVVFISLAKGELTSDAPGFYGGVALLLLSNLVGGSTNILVVKRKQAISPVALTSFANFTGGTMLLITSFIVEKPELKIYPPEFYVALVWLAIIPAAGFSIWYNLLQKPGVKVSELNMLKFVIPVTGAVLSWLLLPGEKPDWISVTGILIITLSLLTLQLPEQKFNAFFRKGGKRTQRPGDAANGARRD
ncbi:MAG: DMT family transporter [Parabacteroides sp.]|nr:DMT family transporter [Parabacteroides sp.]